MIRLVETNISPRKDIKDGDGGSECRWQLRWNKLPLLMNTS